MMTCLKFLIVGGALLWGASCRPVVEPIKELEEHEYSFSLASEHLTAQEEFMEKKFSHPGTSSGFFSFYLKDVNQSLDPSPIDAIEDDQNFLTRFEKNILEQRGIYKIHLQVAESFGISLFNDLFQLFVNSIDNKKSPLRDIHVFKVTTKYRESIFNEKAMPTIVLYVRPLYEPLEERNKILDDIINVFVTRYQHVANKIALRDADGKAIRPRWNARINDLIWIAGGNGDQKAIYQKSDKNKVYTDDYYFIKGYEYTPDPEMLARARQGEESLLVVEPIDDLEEQEFPRWEKEFPRWEKGPREKFGDEKLLYPELLFGWILYPLKNVNPSLDISTVGIIQEPFFTRPFHKIVGDAKKDMVRWFSSIGRRFSCSFAFVDVDNNVYPEHIIWKSRGNMRKQKKIERVNPYKGLWKRKYPFPQESDLQDLDKKDYCNISSEEFKEMQKISIAQLSSTYKIHLQVAKKYFTSLVDDLFQLFSSSADNRDSPLHDIKAFKITTEYKKSRYIEKAMPTIVLYVRLLYEPLEERNKILDDIINVFVTRYQHVANKIALRDDDGQAIRPRWNARINDLIWIAGGNGDDKKEYIHLLERDVLTRNTVYTDDFSFFKGYEYSPARQGEEGVQEGALTRLKRALVLLKAKLMVLAQRLNMLAAKVGR